MASGPLTTHFLSSYHSVLNLTAFQPYLHSHFLVPFDCCFSFTLPSLCFLSIFHSAQLLENSLHPIAKIQLCSGISTPKYHPNPSTSFHLHSPVQVSGILSLSILHLPTHCWMLKWPPHVFAPSLFAPPEIYSTHSSQTNLLNNGSDVFTGCHFNPLNIE